jgi:hypothetical protein
MQLHLSTWPEVETYLAPLNKLASAEDVEKQRAALKKAMEKLVIILGAR